MFIEIRARGKKRNYYLVHSYRVGSKVKRITRYLGSDLNEKTLEKLRDRAEIIILEQIKERSPLEFELSSEEIEFYKSFDKKVEIEHFQKEINWERFTKEFVYNTNAIEGSAVKQEDAKQLIGGKELPENKDEIETVEVAKAVEYLRAIKEKRLSIPLMLKLHQLCFSKTKHFAGRLRNVEVVIRDAFGKVIHEGAPSEDIKMLLKDLVKWYNKHARKYPPLLMAALLHNQFEEIHPFQDGNGRIGRLLLNFALITRNYPPINIRLKDQRRYYRALQRFDKTKDIKPTLKFLIAEYKKQYK